MVLGLVSVLLYPGRRQYLTDHIDPAVHVLTVICLRMTAVPCTVPSVRVPDANVHEVVAPIGILGKVDLMVLLVTKYQSKCPLS